MDSFPHILIALVYWCSGGAGGSCGAMPLYLGEYQSRPACEAAAKLVAETGGFGRRDKFICAPKR